MAMVSTLGAIRLGAAAVSPRIERRSTGRTAPIASAARSMRLTENHLIRRYVADNVSGVRVRTSSLPDETTTEQSDAAVATFRPAPTHAAHAAPIASRG